MSERMATASSFAAPALSLSRATSSSSMRSSGTPTTWAGWVMDARDVPIEARLTAPPRRLGRSEQGARNERRAASGDSATERLADDRPCEGVNDTLRVRPTAAETKGYKSGGRKHDRRFHGNHCVNASQQLRGGGGEDAQQWDAHRDADLLGGGDQAGC